MFKSFLLKFNILTLIFIIAIYNFNFSSSIINTTNTQNIGNLIIEEAEQINTSPNYTSANIPSINSSSNQNNNYSNLTLEEQQKQVDNYYTNLALQTYANLYPNAQVDANAIAILKNALMQEDTINNKKDENGLYNDLGKKFKKGELIGVFTIVGYCPCNKCCGKWSNGTASGAKPFVHHTISVDKKIIPLGTNVIIDGGETSNVVNYEGIYKAEDTGGGVKGNLIDIYRPTHLEAQRVSQSGRQLAYVYKAIPID